MSNAFNKIDTAELLKTLDGYKFSQLHLHHTWKPTHRNFNGYNHVKLQENMENYHVNTLGWDYIGQHLSLFPDGVWVTGRPFSVTPASIKGWNEGALAVEMIGNFDLPGTGAFNDLGYDKLEGEQKVEILKIIKYFIDKYGEQSVKFHRDNPTAGKTCPGTSLNKQDLMREAKLIDKPTGPSDWSKKAWEWATKKKIFDGERPWRDITRQELAIVMHRLVNSRQASVKFDVPKMSGKEAWEWATSKKIFDGTRSKEAATREETAVVLMRFLGENVRISDSLPSVWASDSWRWAEIEGVLDGNRPHSALTREELAIVLTRLEV